MASVVMEPKVAVLCQPVFNKFVTGVRTFVRECERTGLCHAYLMRHGPDGLARAGGAEIPEKGKRYEKYEATIVSTCLYETDNAHVISQFPRPRILYIHGWDSLKHNNTRYMDLIDFIAYDRPLLAKSFTDRYQSLDKPYRELTLPYNPQPLLHLDANPRNVFVQTRIVPDKMVHKILQAAKDLPNFQFTIAGPLTQTKKGFQDYVDEIMAIAGSLENVEMLGSIDDKEEILRRLSTSAIFPGLTKDPNGWQTYGVEYTALEAMNARCVPLINNEMEFEYRRQGARAVFCDMDAPLSIYLQNVCDNIDFVRSQTSNQLFLLTKNARFESQLKGMIEEFKIGGKSQWSAR